MTTTILNTLADTAANWQQVSTGDVVIPKWMAVTAGIIIGITALLGLLSTRLLPMLFKVISQIQDGLRDVQQNAAAAKSVADVNSERVTNLAKATLNMAQASPAPGNAEALRASAVEHAQAALASCPPDVTPTPAPPTPENPQ